MKDMGNRKYLDKVKFNRELIEGKNLGNPPSLLKPKDLNAYSERIEGTLYINSLDFQK